MSLTKSLQFLSVLVQSFDSMLGQRIAGPVSDGIGRIPSKSGIQNERNRADM